MKKNYSNSYKYIDETISNCQYAKTIKPIREFVLSDLSDLKGVRNAIYIIKQTSGDPEDAYKAFLTYKASKSRSCSSANGKSKIMYVGSSTTGIKTRINQHKGYGSKKTYSLHLKKWFKGKYMITIKEYEYDVKREIIQLIEDDLSATLKPAFGKQGGNNK